MFYVCLTLWELLARCQSCASLTLLEAANGASRRLAEFSYELSSSPPVADAKAFISG
ncbi:hypothetical protein KCP74_22540 [Salmonella enterica subsp. enterica]|nr:hypothetical protein KCP74_22540 [Salmonella enterica subsp. enterica]